MLNGFLVKTNVEVTPRGQTVITPNNKLKHYLLLFRFSFWRGNYLTELNVFKTVDSQFLIKLLNKKRKEKTEGVKCSEKRMASNTFIFAIIRYSFWGPHCVLGPTIPHFISQVQLVGWPHLGLGCGSGLTVSPTAPGHHLNWASEISTWNLCPVVSACGCVFACAGGEWQNRLLETEVMINYV